MNKFLPILFLFLPLLSLSPAAKAQSANPSGITICSTSSLAVSGTSSNVQLSACGPSVIIWNVGSVEVFINVGTASSTTATTSSASIPNGTQLVLNVGNSAPYLAAITASSTSTIRITQGWGIVVGRIGGANITPPPACSNVLDFSVACNSQYINVVGL